MTSLSLDVADILDIGKWSVYETVSSLSLPFSLCMSIFRGGAVNVSEWLTVYYFIREIVLVEWVSGRL